MEPAVIVSAVRTPIGTFGGALKETPATKLGAVVVAEAVKRAHLAPDQIGEVIVGNILQAGLGLTPPRAGAPGAGSCAATMPSRVSTRPGLSIKAVILG